MKTNTALSADEYQIASAESRTATATVTANSLASTVKRLHPLEAQKVLERE